MFLYHLVSHHRLQAWCFPTPGLQEDERYLWLHRGLMVNMVERIRFGAFRIFKNLTRQDWLNTGFKEICIFIIQRENLGSGSIFLWMWWWHWDVKDREYQGIQKKFYQKNLYLRWILHKPDKIMKTWVNGIGVRKRSWLKYELLSQLNRYNI